MTNYEVAKLIPASVRKQLIADNIIYKAIVVANDVHMTILTIVYNNHIFNEGEPIDMKNPCLACLTNILDTFKLLLPELVTLEKESKLLEEV